MVSYNIYQIKDVIRVYNKKYLIACDATLNSYGIYCGGYGISELLPQTLNGQPIHLTEAYAILASIYAFRKYIEGHNVIIFTDNKAAQAVFTRYWAKDGKWEPYLFHYVKMQYQYKCIVDVKYIKGECNVFADALSRGQWIKYHEYCRKYNRPDIGRIRINPIII